MGELSPGAGLSMMAALGFGAATCKSLGSCLSSSPSLSPAQPAVRRQHGLRHAGCYIELWRHRCDRLTRRPPPLRRSKRKSLVAKAMSSDAGTGVQQEAQEEDRSHGGDSLSSKASVVRWMRSAVAVAGLIGLGCTAWGGNLSAAGLVDDTEPLFAEAARQMVLTGDWITPQFNGQARFDKPALVYWLMALSVKCFGLSEWALRLPSMLCAAALTVALTVTVARFGLHSPAQLAPIPVAAGEVPIVGEKSERAEGFWPKRWTTAGIVAAAFTLNFGVVIWGSTALSDMALTSAVGGTLLSWFWAYAGGVRWGYLSAALCMGLAMLAKGPVGVVLPVGVCLLFLSYTGELIQFMRKELPWISGLGVFLATAVPWFTAVTRIHGWTYIKTFFGYHNVERFVRGVNHHGGRPLGYSVGAGLAVFFPWSLALPAAIARTHFWDTRALWRILPRGERLLLFSVAWAFVVFGFFSLSSSQLPSYYLPLAPAVAMLAASLWSPENDAPAKGYSLKESRMGHNWGAVATTLATAGTMMASAVGLWALPFALRSSGDSPTANIGMLLQAKGYNVIGAGIFVAMSLAAACLSIISTAAWLEDNSGDWYRDDVRRRHLTQPQRAGWPNSVRRLWLVNTIGMAVFLLAVFTPAYRAIDAVRQQPLRNLSVVAQQSQVLSEPLAMVGTRMPSVVFYSGQPVAYFDTAQEAVEVFRNEARGVKSVLVLAERQLWDQLPPSQKQVLLATEGDYMLVRVPLS
eukprot:jgi/Chlat1/7658/Chrsp64S07118